MTGGGGGAAGVCGRAGHGVDPDERRRGGRVRAVVLAMLATALTASGLAASAGTAAASAPFVPETFTAGNGHSCALDSTMQAWCWGSDSSGQIGDGPASQGNNYNPVRVAGAHRFQYITAGAAHTCALDTAFIAWCWGADVAGQLGDSPAGLNQLEPVQVWGGRQYFAITANGSVTCALDFSGKAWCWGTDRFGQVGNGSPATQAVYLPEQVAAGSSIFIAISAGSDHVCALDNARKAWCWGGDSSGQAGDGPDRFFTKYSPVRVLGDASYSAIESGGAFTCALDTAGRAWCWGSDSNGMLGDGAGAANKAAPVLVAGGRAYATIAAGGSTVCALDAATMAWCWGWDRYGQVGDGPWGQLNNYSPVRVAGERGYAAITGGAVHMCAADTGWALWCWGSDQFGQVGDGPASQADKTSPVPVVIYNPAPPGQAAKSRDGIPSQLKLARTDG